MSAAAKDKPPRFDDTIRVFRAGLANMYRSRLPQMAAALAYRTIFALIPTLVISVAAIGVFAKPETIRNMVYDTLEAAGLDITIEDPVKERADELLGPENEVEAQSLEDLQPTVEGQPVEGEAVEEKLEEKAEDESEQIGGPPNDDQEEGVEAGADDQTSSDEVGPPPPDEDNLIASPNLSTESSNNGTVSFDEIIAGILDQIFEIRFAAVGAVGLLTLIYASISMLIEIERAFNVIYRAQAGKSWGRRLTQYWSIITLVPIFLFSAYYASEQFRDLGERVFNTSGGGVLAFVGSLVSVAITALLLLLAYVIIPNVRVRISTGVVGAFVAAILWEFAKWGFRQYLSYSVGYSNIYGNLALLPLALLWVYLTWLIILFGLQVSYGLQHIELAKQIEEEDADNRLTDPAAVFGVLAVIAGRFERGKATGLHVLTDELSLPARVIGSITDKLRRSEIIRALDDDEQRYTLARPADQIMLDEAMAAMAGITDAGVAAESNWTRAVERLDRARQDVVKGLTVEDLLSEKARNGTRHAAGKSPDPVPDKASKPATLTPPEHTSSPEKPS